MTGGMSPWVIGALPPPSTCQKRFVRFRYLDSDIFGERDKLICSLWYSAKNATIAQFVSRFKMLHCRYCQLVVLLG